MGNPLSWKDGLYIETGPRSPNVTKYVQGVGYAGGKLPQYYVFTCVASGPNEKDARPALTHVEGPNAFHWKTAELKVLHCCTKLYEPYDGL